jgi:hypothetical protein
VIAILYVVGVQSALREIELRSYEFAEAGLQLTDRSEIKRNDAVLLIQI